MITHKRTNHRHIRLDHTGLGAWCRLRQVSIELLEHFTYLLHCLDAIHHRHVLVQYEYGDRLDHCRVFRKVKLFEQLFKMIDDFLSVSKYIESVFLTHVQNVVCE